MENQPLITPIKPKTNYKLYWLIVFVLWVIDSLFYILFSVISKWNTRLYESLIAAPIGAAMAGVILGLLIAFIPYKKLSYRNKFYRAFLIGIIVWEVFYMIPWIIMGIRYGISI